MNWLQLARAPAVFSAASNTFAAQLIVTDGRIQAVQLLTLAGISVCLYAGGMILNDCFDLEEDRRDRPSRPLPAGRIPARSAWRAGFMLLLAAALLSLTLQYAQLLIVLALIGSILLYNGGAKNTGAGPFVMGACRYGNWFLGLSTAGFGPATWLLPIPVFLYTVVLTVLSRDETGQTRRRTGVAETVGIICLLLVVLWLGYQDLLKNNSGIIVIVAAGIGLIVYLLSLRRHYDAASVQKAVSLMIFGIIPLDAMLASAAGPWWAGLPVLLLLLPARALGRMLYVT